MIVDWLCQLWGHHVQLSKGPHYYCPTQRSAGLRVRCTKGHKLVQYLAILGSLSTKNQDTHFPKWRGFWSNYWANCYNSLFLNYIRALWRDFFTITWCDLGWGCYNLHRKYRIVKFFPTQPRSLRYLISKGRPIDQDAAKFQKEGHVVYGEYRLFFRICRV